jgi:hypothetical protein
MYDKERRKYLMIKLIRLFIITSCMIAPVAHSQTLNHSLSPIEQAFSGNPPLGKGDLYSFVFKLYDIALWADSAECATGFSCPMALETVQNLGASREKLLSKTLEKIIYCHPELSKERIALYKKRLETLYPECVNAGDTIQVLLKPEENLISFYHKGKEEKAYTLKGSVNDGEFGRHFFEIWLHPHGPYGDLRAQLLGLAKS